MHLDFENIFTMITAAFCHNHTRTWWLETIPIHCFSPRMEIDLFDLFHNPPLNPGRKYTAVAECGFDKLRLPGVLSST